jgi:hypothetical protein
MRAKTKLRSLGLIEIPAPAREVGPVTCSNANMLPRNVSSMEYSSRYSNEVLTSSLVPAETGLFRIIYPENATVGECE